MDTLLVAILDDDRPRARELLTASPGLAKCVMTAARLYQSKITHWMYVGDTPLHLAAAGYRVEIARWLLAAGANPNAAGNHRQGRPLHYAADGCPDRPGWDARQQVEIIECLLLAGADIHAQDKNGAAPLHRAVRTRCAAAVKFLLERGANATLRNQAGSLAFHLAVQNTGRGGSGAGAAKAAQRAIILEFLALGQDPTLPDGQGKTVRDCARSAWIRALLDGEHETPG